MPNGDVDALGVQFVEVKLNNQTTIDLDAVSIDEAGTETSEGMLSATSTAVKTSPVGLRWRLRDRVTHALAAEHVTDERESQEIVIERRSPEARQRTTITFRNLTLLKTTVRWVDFEGEEREFATLSPGGNVELTTYSGHFWIVRDKATLRAMAIAKAESGPATVEVTGASLISQANGIPVTVVFKNNTPADVDLFQVDAGGIETAKGAVAPGASSGQPSQQGELWRVREQATGSLVAELYASDVGFQFREILASSFEGLAATTIVFRNELELDVDLMLVTPSGEIRFKGLSPMESFDQGAYASQRWIARDAHSGTPLGTVVAGTAPASLTIDRGSIPAPAGGTAVEVAFRNLTSLTMVAIQDGSEGNSQQEAVIPPGDAVTRQAISGVLWRFLEQDSRVQTGIFIPGAGGPQTADIRFRSANSRQEAELAIMNETTLRAEICWVDYDGVLQPRGILEPGDARRFGTFLTHPWCVRDALSKKVVAIRFADKEKQLFVLRNETIRTTPSTSVVRQLFTNMLPFIDVDMFEVMESGEERFVGGRAPGLTLSPDTVPGRLWRFRNSQSNFEVASFVAGAQQQNFEIRLRPRGDEISTEIEFMNASPLDLELIRIVDEQFVSEGIIKPRESQEVATFATHPWLVRHVQSRRIAGFVYANPQRQIVRITGEGLRSAPTTDVDVTFRNTTRKPLDVRLVDLQGIAEQFAVIDPGAELRVQTGHGSVWRFFRKGTETQVDLFIPSVEEGLETEQTYEIKNALIRVGARPSGELFSGEVALFDGPEFGGNVVIIHSDMEDFSDVEDLDDRVSSIKLGPNTSVTAFRDAGFAGTNDVFLTNAGSFEGTDVGDDQISSIRVTATVPPERVFTNVSITLSEDFRVNDAGQLERFSVHRCVLSAPPEVVAVDVFGLEEVTIASGGVRHTIDAVRPVQLAPDISGNLMITIDAGKLAAPGLQLRTNTMRANERIFVFPDRDAARRIAGMAPGTLFENRERLSLAEGFTAESTGQVQTAIQNLYRTIPRDNLLTDSAESALDTDAMDFSQWALTVDPSPGAVEASFRPISGLELAGLQEGAVVVGDSIAQGIIEDFVPGIGKPLEIGFNVLKRGGEEALEKVGEGIQQAGDVLKENLAAPIEQAFQKAAAIVEKAIEITVRAGEQAFRFLVNTAKQIGDFVEDVIAQIGSTVKKFVEFLQFIFDWDSILETHDALADLCNRGLGKGNELLAALRSRLDLVFSSFTAESIAGIDDAMKELTGGLQTAQGGTSKATEEDAASQWFRSKLSEGLPGASKGPEETEPDDELASLFEAFLERLEARAEEVLPVVTQSIEEAFGSLQRVAAEPANALNLIGAALLGVVKAVTSIALTAVRELLDGLLTIVQALLKLLSKILNEPLQIPFLSGFYRSITNQELTILSVSCLAIAIPATITSKIIFGAGPADGLQNVTLELTGRARSFSAMFLGSFAGYGLASILEEATKAKSESQVLPVGAVTPVKRFKNKIGAGIIIGFRVICSALILVASYPFGFDFPKPGAHPDKVWFAAPEQQAFVAWITAWYILEVDLLILAARAAGAIKKIPDDRMEKFEKAVAFVLYLPLSAVYLGVTAAFTGSDAVRRRIAEDIRNGRVPSGFPNAKNELPKDLEQSLDSWANSGRHARFVAGNLLGAFIPVAQTSGTLFKRPDIALAASTVLIAGVITTAGTQIGLDF